MMNQQRQTPKFLTQRVAQCAVDTVLNATILSSDLTGTFKRTMCHVVVLVPSIDRAREPSTEWPNCSMGPYCLYEKSVGDRKEWPHDFSVIARSKAMQLWQDRNDDRTDVMPHLLFSGDTAFWGGVKRSGIVVTCSGVQAYFDKMIAGMTADMCIALAYHNWMTSNERNEGAMLLG